MTILRTMKIILSKKFLKYFLVSFLILWGILLLQFLARYNEDVLFKGFSINDLIKLVYHNLLNLTGFSLLFAILIASMFSFRYFTNSREIAFKKELTGNSIIVLILALLFFGFTNRILPKSKLEMTSILYEMKATAPGNNIQRVNRDVFRDLPSNMTIKNIKYKTDTLNNNINEYKHLCDSLLALLPDSVAQNSYKTLSLDDYGIIFTSSKTDTMSERGIKFADNYLKLYQGKLKKTVLKKQKYLKEKASRIILPVELILLYIIGASFGYFYNDQKGFLLLILGLYTLLVFYRIEQTISNNISDNIGGSIVSMTFIITVTVIFLIKGLNKEKNRPPE